MPQPELICCVYTSTKGNKCPQSRIKEVNTLLSALIECTLVHAAKIVFRAVKTYVNDISEADVLAATVLSPEPLRGEIMCAYLHKKLKTELSAQLQLHEISEKIISGGDAVFSKCSVSSSGFVNFTLSDRTLASALSAIDVDGMFALPPLSKRTVTVEVMSSKNNGSAYLRLFAFAQCMCRLYSLCGSDIQLLHYPYKSASADIILAAAADRETARLRAAELSAAQKKDIRCIVGGECSLSEFIPEQDFCRTPCSAYWLVGKSFSAPLRLNTERCLCENLRNPYHRAVYLHKRLTAVLSRQPCGGNAALSQSFSPQERLIIAEIIRFGSVSAKSVREFELCGIAAYLSKISGISLEYYRQIRSSENVSQHSLQLCFILKNLIEHIFFIFGIKF